MQPHTSRQPCPICEGHPNLPQGKAQRCWGFISADGEYAHCTRPELAGAIPQNTKSQTYPHRLHGPCKCGKEHGTTAEVRSIGEAKGARIVETYDYTDEHGKLLFQVVRKEPKAFPQRKPDGHGGWIWNLGNTRRVLYRLPAVIEAVAAGDTIHIVEGEKDANSVWKAGGVGTCNPEGANKWRDDYAKYLRGADVVIVRDRDVPGNEHARQVFKSLRGVAGSIRVVEAAEGKDAYDHLAAGKRLDDFIPVWPLDELEKSDPVAWRRAIVRRSLEIREDPITEADRDKALREKAAPMWPTALDGEPTFLRGFRGVTFMTGGPSAGKTWWATGSAISAAWAGWHVIYLASEMSAAQVYRRATAFTAGGETPAGFEVYEVTYGVTVQNLVDLIASKVSENKMLVVLDSISSFVDQAQFAETQDVHRIGPLKRLTMWALNVRRDTRGKISFLLLSEKNAQGETKGRFGDHKADMVVTIATDPERPTCKRIAVTKSWESEVGPLGLYGLNPREARLTRLGN